MNVYDLRLRLRNDPPGTHVTFGVRRGGDSRMVTLTLRDLI
jgi:S1-C subfamily serine protease